MIERWERQDLAPLGRSLMTPLVLRAHCPVTNSCPVLSSSLSVTSPGLSITNPVRVPDLSRIP